jgi:nucleoside-diphosphate-sugar epimerase
VSVDVVTGATGFIGGHLVRRLLGRGRRVRLLVRPASIGKLDADVREHAETAVGDLRDGSGVRDALRGVTRVFHCAGHVSDWGTEDEFAAVNVAGTERLLEAAAAEGALRFVHLSTIAVFGVPSPPIFDDASPYGDGRDLYSRTKIAGERVALRAHEKGGVPVTVLRPPVVYGPKGPWAEGPIAMMRAGKMFLIGGGRGTCHPCYIENLLDAIELAAEHPRAPGRAYMAGDDEPISFAEYFNHLARIAGQRPVRRSIPLPIARAMASAFEAAARLRGSRTRPLLTQTAIDMITAQSRMSMRRIRDELGYTPRFGVAAAMDEMARWFASS